MKAKNIIQRNSILLFAAVALYILLRILIAAQSDLWTDEVFSVLTARRDWAEMFSVIVSDGVHPPLFYVLLKIWSFGGWSIWWLQMFPLAVSILTVVPLYLFCRELKLTGLETATVFFAVAVNGYFLEYALDLRMYGLLQFFTLFSLWSFIRLPNTNDAKQSKAFGLLAVVNLLLVYTHYFGWLIIGLEAAYLLVWQRRFFYRYAVNCLVVLLGFVPWILLVLRNAAANKPTGNLDWLTRPSISDFLGFYSGLNGTLYFPHATIIGLMIFGLPVAVLIWRAWRHKREESDARFLIFFAFAPVVIVFFLSLLLPKSVWESRYLIIAAAPYIVLIVKAAFALPTETRPSGRVEHSMPTETRLSGKVEHSTDSGASSAVAYARASVFILIILIWVSIAGFYNFGQSSKKIQWSAAAQIIADNPSTQSVYTLENWVFLPLGFYLNEAHSPARIEKLNSLAEARNESFWLAFRRSTDNQNNELRETLNAKGCRITREDTFPDASQTVTLLRLENCASDNLP